MFEFLIALFGGLYYGGRYAIEKQRDSAADKRNKELTQTLTSDFDRWMSRVVDDKLEYEVRNNLDSEEAQEMRQRILNEVHLNPADDVIIMALLAQKAKIPAGIAMGGIRTFSTWDRAGQQRCARQRQLLTWYDRELRRHGIQEPLLFVDRVNENKICYNINLAVPITATSTSETICDGKYFWAPMRLTTA